MALIIAYLLAFILAPLLPVQAGPRECVQITLKSTLSTPDSRVVKAGDGDVQAIVKVEVWDQISALPCVEKVNYFYYSHFLIVKDGCKATFKVCYEIPEPTTTPAPLTTIEPGCEKIGLYSRQNRPVSRALDSEVTSMTLLRDVNPKVTCERGVNFGFDGTVVFATGGCRGVFQVCATGVQPLTTAPPAVTCNYYKILGATRRTIRDSNNQLATITGVDLVHEFSKGVCVEGRNYFSRGSVFVVNRGCKGAFRVCFEAAMTTPAPLTTTAPEPVCKQINVKSTVNQPGRVDVTDSSGNPVQIIHIHVWDQISEVKCKEWVTYFYSASSITTRDGCHATFKVCYAVIAPTTPAPLTTTAPPAPGCDFITLLSRRNRRAVVRFPDATISSMTLVRQLGSSRADCIVRRTFGYRENKAIARNGCRGVFQVCFDTSLLTTTAAPETCRKYKILQPTRTRVRDSNGQLAVIVSISLVREISSYVCQEGVNYFSRGSLLVVRGGCKGIFNVCYEEAPTTPAPLTTTEAPVMCDKVDVKSRGSRPRRVDVRDSNGNPVVIVHVHVWDQISKVKCKEGVTYFVSESSITARDGCQATFKVCYRQAPQTTPAALTTPEPEICKRYQILKPTRRTVTDSNSQPVSITSFVLIREISKYVCEDGVNYLAAGSRFEVRGGCKGVFRVCYVGASPAPLTTQAPEPNCKKVTPNGRVEVTDSRGRPVDIVHVKVWDQISVTRCVRGVNYFVNDATITVRRGCRATFKVCYFDLLPTPIVGVTTVAALTTTAAPVTCNTYIVLGHTRRVIVGSNGQPAQITRVNLIREISKHVCRRRVNFFYRGSIFIVNGGCKGKFRVCYEENPTTPAPLTTGLPVECKRHKILSPARKTIRDGNNNPATVTSVTLVREISYGVCQEGVNFFFRGAVVVARGGCKGIFEICYTRTPTTPAPLTTTASGPMCRKYTLEGPVEKKLHDREGQPVEITELKLVRDFTSGGCVQSKTYKGVGSTISVGSYCKGVFHVCYAPAAPTTTVLPLTTANPAECKKHKILSPARKTIQDGNNNPATVTSVTLVREISYGVCQEGVNFFFREAVVVVRGGCKGIFEICYTRTPTTPAPLTTAAPAPNPQLKCQKINVKSKGDQPGSADIKDSNGNPVHIAYVAVYSQVSQVKCVKGYNFFFSQSSIVTKKGCHAKFKVCYKEKAPAPTTAAALTTTAPQPICRKYTLEGPVEKEILDGQGNPADITDFSLVRDFTKGGCVYPKTFSSQGSTIRVGYYCKGVFQVCYSPAPPTTPAQALTTTSPGETCRKYTLVSPATRDLRDADGNPAEITRFDLVKQKGPTPCVSGSNFEFSGSTLTVRGGCVGVFRVCIVPGNPAPLTTAPPAPAVECKKIKLDGTGAKPDIQVIKSSAGRHFVFKDIILLKEFSSGVCKKLVSYFATGNSVIAKKGCKGKFKVCYKILK